MAYDIRLEGKNLVNALSLLEDIAKILDKLKIDYWLEGGTLLGVRRENRLLPWDNDVDLSLMVLDRKNENELISALKKSGFRVRLRKYESDHDYCKKDDSRLIKIRKSYLFGLIKGAVCLEIFIKYKVGDKAYWKIGDVVKNVPYKYYAKTKKVEFNNYRYSIPELTDEYLTYRYGDWQTPKENYNPFKDDNALKK